jgi:PKD repeat protein
VATVQGRTFVLKLLTTKIATLKQINTLLFLFLITSTSLFGQLWNKPNAKWSFGSYTFGVDGQMTYQLHQDTTILGMSCKNVWMEYAYVYSEGLGIDSGRGPSGFYFYEQDSVVYQYGLFDFMPGFDTLYNFKALPNESWTIQNNYCDSIFKITVTDTGHTLIGQSNVYYLVVDYEASNTDVSSINYTYFTASDTIFEGFGSKHYPFLSWEKFCLNMFDGIVYWLNCYSDINISWGTNCEITIDNCSANFYLYADTLNPHNWFLVNTSTSENNPYSCNWNWGDGSHDTIPFPSHTYDTAGFYIVSLSINDGLGCTSFKSGPLDVYKTEANMVTISVISPQQVGVQQVNQPYDFFTVYPNPALSKITIQANSKQAMLTDLSGKTLLTIKLNKGQAQIDVSSFDNGIYFLQTDNGQTQKLIIQH